MAVDAVLRVLADRARVVERSRRGEIAALTAAALLHLGVVAAALAFTLIKPRPEPIDFVAARIVPAQALGVERPRKRAEAPEPPAPKPAEAAAPPEPEPPAPEPPPVETPPAKPQPAPVPTGPLPRPKGWNDPPPQAATPAPPAAPAAKPAPAKPAQAAPPAKPPAPAKPSAGTGTPGPGADVAKGTEVGPRGSASGTAAGTSPFGDRIASIDPDFTYGYYIEQLLRQIDSKWTPPRVGSNVRTIVRFRILRRGDIDLLDVAETSSINAFDLAALRAVQNAAPFPPLPASYRNPNLSVNLIVR